MKPFNAATIFHVSDLDAALQYYTHVLGFSMDFRYGTIAGLKYDEVFIQLSAPNPGVTKKAIGEGHVYIFCDEVDEYYQQITEKGAFITIAPEDRDYGMRDFGVKDVDGNRLDFGKETGQ